MGTSVISLKNSQGFTLLEVLVAITISVILLGGAIQMLSSSKRVYALQTE
jgi:prepilin-type N-terminal cleavage/methylation domain-containing protein